VSPRTSESPGLRVGSVWGVPVYLGTSWFVLALVIILITGQSLRSLGGTGYVVGVLYVLALLVAVLVHETAHAVVGRALGLRVHRIVADLWGGHTSYDAEGANPGNSAVVAVAGPIANGLLGVGAFLAQPAFAGEVPSLLVWGIAWTNLLLAAFNLLPGLPLDGGQLVESAVWAFTGRRDRGLVAAGWSGRVVAVLVVVWMVLRPMLAGRSPSLTSVVWVLLVAGFMWTGATGAIRHGQARRALVGVTATSVSRPCIELPASTPFTEALAHGRLVVSRDERGIPTLVLLSLPEQEPAPGTPLSAVVTRVPDEAVLEVAPDADITRIIQAMNSTGWGVCVLTSEGRPYAVADAESVNLALADAN
jgi:Zn-dependent protease